ncbi:MAG: hypothetical protein U9Q96_02215 [Patescibacteria group bacterium]|nr:hypothetical protein [Patescibacteria group bacterium]
MSHKERLWKVVVPLFLGGAIGTMVALNINSNFWWLGMLAGGFVGYFSYDFKSVIQGWRNFGAEFKKVTWVENKCKIGTFGVMTVSLGGVGFLLSFFPIVLEGSRTEDIVFTALILFFLLFAVAMLAIMGYVLEFELIKAAAPDRVLVWLERGMPRAVITISRFLLIKVPGFLLIKVPVSFYKGVLRFFGMIWEFLRFIHSDLRLLIGFDAMLGTVIGYFGRNILIGGISAIIVGVGSYLLIYRRLVQQNQSAG